MKGIHKNIIFYIIIVVIAGLIVAKKKYQPTRKSINKLKQKKIATFSDIKQDNLMFFHDNFSGYNINIAFIEYKYNNIRHALIISRDSVSSIISIYEPEIVNAFYKDSIGKLSIDLLNVLEKRDSELPFKKQKRKFSNIRNNEITVYIHPKNSQLMLLKITATNYKETRYKIILSHFIKLISKLNYSDVTINELIQTTK